MQRSAKMVHLLRHRIFFEMHKTFLGHKKVFGRHKKPKTITEIKK